MSNYYISERHQELIRASAISKEVVAERGYRTVTDKAELMQLGFVQAQCRVPALLIPIYDCTGKVVTHQSRPDNPRANGMGKKLKYEIPQGSRMVLDVHPMIQAELADPNVALYITEGARKGDSAISKGLCCITLMGVWGWRGTNKKGGKTALPDWNNVALNNRHCYICFDSDAATNKYVKLASERLRAFLQSRGAIVDMIDLPSSPNGEKVGLDDFFAAGHTAEELHQYIRAHSNTAGTGHSIHPAQPVYKQTDDGITYVKPSGEIVRLTNFTAVIKNETTRDDGVDKEIYFEIEAKVEGKLVRFSLSSTEFEAMRWPIKYLGAKAVIYPGAATNGHAKVAIQCLSNEIETICVYTHTGWRKVDEEWVYLHSGGAIGKNGALSDVRVELNDSLRRFALLEPPSGDDLVNAINASLRLLTLVPDEVGFALFSLIWAAVVCPVHSSIHLAGPTGVFKSELAALVQQHWGQELDAHHLPASWTGTGNALETMAFHTKDAVLVVDDFAPAGSHHESMQLQKTAERLFRAQGNVSGKLRLTSDARLRSVKPPRGAILSTGEDVPNGHSLRARTVVIEINNDTVRSTKELTQCQKDAVAGKYAQTMAAFIKWVAPIYEEVGKSAKCEIDKLRDQIKGTNMHNRTPSNVAELAYGIRVFLDFCIDISALSKSEAESIWERCCAAMTQIAKSQEQHQIAAEPAGQFIKLITGALMSGHAHLVSADGNNPINAVACGWRENQELWSPKGECIGFVEGDDVFLFPSPSYNLARRTSKDSCSELLISEKTLHKRLHEHGLLKSTDETRKTLLVRRTYGGNRIPVLHLSMRTLFSQETDQPDQNSKNERVEVENGQIIGQFNGQKEAVSDHESDQKNCPKEDTLSTNECPVGRLVSYSEEDEDVEEKI